VGWAGERAPGSQRVLTLLNFSLHAELITVVSDVCADIPRGRGTLGQRETANE